MSLEIVEKIKTEFASDILASREVVAGEWELHVKQGAHLRLLEKLKSDEGGAFVHLSDLTAYDVHPKTPRFHVIYFLISMNQKRRLQIVVPLNDAENPTLESATGLWPGAGWLEREVYDMFGVHFSSHPDERRILLPPSFKGHPLRKDFIVDYRQKFPEPTTKTETFDPFGNTVLTQSTGKDS